MNEMKLEEMEWSEKFYFLFLYRSEKEWEQLGKEWKGME